MSGMCREVSFTAYHRQHRTREYTTILNLVFPQSGVMQSQYFIIKEKLLKGHNSGKVQIINVFSTHVRNSQHYFTVACSPGARGNDLFPFSLSLFRYMYNFKLVSVSLSEVSFHFSSHATFSYEMQLNFFF